jgi:aminoglycoside phosphotransferase (APT) family kinase protein
VTGPDPAIAGFVAGAGLLPAGAAVDWQALTGGVSSDIWLATAGGVRICVKRALPRLRVAADWRAPVERSRYEADWLAGAARILPGAAPALLAADADAAMLAMEYLDPAQHRLWKAELMAGRADPAAAAAVGDRLARLHDGFARDPDAAATFPRDDIFHAIRLEPYLIATGRAHPALAPRLKALAERTLATRRSVVHGDVSPKNILLGPGGPVLLDAECAWFGDPAFDLAFCLNHLLLKCLPQPDAVPALLACFDALAGAYLAGVGWEPAAAVEARAAALLPALFLARIDGKSPVEYVTDDADRDRVRRVAIPLVAAPPGRLAAVRDTWAAALTARSPAS